MNAYQRIASELKAFFTGNSIFKALLPLDVYILYACLAALVLNNFISLGGLLNAIAYYGFFFALLLVFSNQNNKVLYTGLFIYAAAEAFQVVKYGVFQSYRFIDFFSLITFIIFGYLAYLIYKYDVKKLD